MTVPLLVFLLLGEVLVRAFRAPTHLGSFRDLRTNLLKRNYPAEKDLYLGYVPRANFSSRDNHWGTWVSIDADGLRKNGTATPQSGIDNVICVGDSFTFGDEVDDDASYPAQMEIMLGQPVKNGGVFGYSFTQAALRAEVLMDRFPTSDLVLAFISDDLTRSEFSRRYTPVPWFDFEHDGIVLRGVPVDHDAPHPDPSNYWKDLVGYSALADAILANTARSWWFESSKQIVVPHLAGKGKDICKQLVGRLSKSCRMHGARLLLVLLGERARPDAIELLQHAANNGIDTLNLASTYQSLLAADPSLKSKWFNGHMTREGNKWVAEQIASQLRRNR